MSILLLGAGGQVGREIAELAKTTGVQLTACGREEIDLRDRTVLADVLRKQQPRLVINAAAYTAVDKAELEPEQAFAVNARACALLAELCAEQRAMLLHFSTDYVFDGRLGRAYREEDAPQPTSVYGRSKLEGERAIADRLPEHVILRVSWVFGRFGRNFVKTMVRMACEREELRVVNDQWGCPCAAAHIAEVALDIARGLLSGSRYFGLFHYADHPSTTWHAFAEQIVRCARAQGLPVKTQRVLGIPTAEYPTPATRPQYAVLNSEKLRNTWGIAAQNWADKLPEVVTTP